jgi:TonB family protein
MADDTARPRSVSENLVVGPRASGFVTDKDGEAGDIGVYRRCSRTQSSRKTSRPKPDRILRQAPRWSLNGLTLVMALAANGLLFYALVWARTRPASTLTRDTDVSLIVSIAPAQSSPVTGDPVSTPAAQRPADVPQPDLPPLARVEAIRSLDHQIRPNPMAADLPGMTVALAQVVDLWRTQPLPTPDIQGPLSVERVDRIPVKTAGPGPTYPAWARRRGWEAVVILRFVITTTGAVTDLKIHNIAGHERFGKAALDAVSQWRFQPALKQGKPVACWRFQKINFVRDP